MPIFKPKILNSLELGAQSIPFDDPDIINFLSPGDHSKYVSASRALHNSDIFSIVMQLSGDLATVKLKANMPRAQGILDKPSVTSNTHAFWQSMFAQLLLAGECFAYRWRNVNGVDLRWEYLRPSQVSPFLLEDGSGLIYDVSFDEPQIGVIQAIPQADMIHMRLMSKNGGMTGMSPLSALANELEIKKSSDNLTLSALAQSVISPGVLKIKNGGLLNLKAKIARSQNFMRQIKSSDSGPIVLDDLEDYTPLQIQSNVANLLNQVNWTSTQIAKVYGVPDSFLNGSGDQQSSSEMARDDYTIALNRYLRSILSELNDKLSADIAADVRAATDPLGDGFATTLANISKSGGLANNQFSWLLQNAGYLPEDMPAAKQQPIQQVVVGTPSEGGDNDDSSTD
ncbi:phage portal protein [Liquorilactobacillus mali]|uniref:HK97 family phage portal protein n=1 Tax=Liquorilactobacillus mali KCTC 3596 = DSM 20444 TaxID=1046596 RepID=J1F3W6_9LACO|nr:phage portal protein [Liquorilactobacillus mali]EJF00338.1 HK97 family phage portal protein [Liquorilactobacillus mali KCTC 3596 = DSM 20444]KRN08822.1 HK97 family phage portal protein [Liquorilactobacillus mali KCTC 3596 = DSM 20444]QFQ74573.1 phage portal protein [Liquorilactobacillus mali]